MMYGNPHLDKHLITNTARTVDSLMINTTQRLYLYRWDPYRSHVVTMQSRCVQACR
jgi:hypothetical protein